MSGKRREGRQKSLVIEEGRREGEKMESDGLWKLTVFSVWACNLIKGGVNTKFFFVNARRKYTVEASFYVFIWKKVQSDVQLNRIESATIGYR